MPKINRIIGNRAWEFIRDRIGEILQDELSFQADLGYEPEISLKTFTVERTNYFDKTEMPACNIAFAQGSAENKDIKGADGSYIYNIDFYTNAAAMPKGGGDQIATLNLHRLLGLAQSILEDPIYKTLGFAPPYISRIYLGETNIAAAGNNDSRNTMMGRVQLHVLVYEKNVLIKPKLIEGYDTTVKIGTTEKGFKYTGENYS